jgi:membrane-bound lytic murein transglycosylase D
LGSWPLTITAYNHGKNGILRAKKQFGSDLATIITKYRSRYFGFASKNFYAEFLAAVLVAKNYETYFGPLEFAVPLEFETVKLKKPYDSSYFVTVPGLSQEVLSEYNPHLQRVFASSGRTVPSGLDLRVPVGKGDSLKVALKSAQPSNSGLMIASDGSARYRVRRGDVLGDIATSFGTSVGSLKRLNGLRNANRIYAGQVLLISSATEPTLSGNAKPATPSSYRVRSGDTLTSIATRFNTTARELAKSNSISNPNRIRVGTSLTIPNGTVLSSKRYRVRRGDTLAKIARRFGTSVNSIKSANQIRNPNLIQQGQELVIP